MIFRTNWQWSEGKREEDEKGQKEKPHQNWQKGEHGRFWEILFVFLCVKPIRQSAILYFWKQNDGLLKLVTYTWCYYYLLRQGIARCRLYPKAKEKTWRGIKLGVWKLLKQLNGWWGLFNCSLLALPIIILKYKVKYSCTNHHPPLPSSHIVVVDLLLVGTWEERAQSYIAYF